MLHSMSYLSDNVTDWLDNAASFHSAIGDARQQRSEGKVVSGRDNLNIERRMFQAFEEASASPTSSQHHHLLLRDTGVGIRSSEGAPV